MEENQIAAAVEAAGEMSAEELAATEESPAQDPDSELSAIVEAIVYVTKDPLTVEQIAAGLQQPQEKVRELMDRLIESYNQRGRGLMIQEVAGGYRMGTKPEHNDAVRQFVKTLQPPLKLSLAALETLAVIAYKQPITAPEVLEIRGVQGAGVLKTLLDRKLISTAGRKQVVGKPILYRTTREFLIQFGLKDLSELPTLKEFEELRRFAISDEPPPEPGPAGESETAPSADPIPPTE
jgi:segregation and condensation protein B